MKRESIRFIIKAHMYDDIRDIVERAKSYVYEHNINIDNNVKIRLNRVLEPDCSGNCFYDFEVSYNVNERVNFAITMLDWSQYDEANRLHALQIGERFLDIKNIKYKDLKIESMYENLNVVHLSYMEV